MGGVDWWTPYFSKPTAPVESDLRDALAFLGYVYANHPEWLGELGDRHEPLATRAARAQTHLRAMKLPAEPAEMVQAALAHRDTVH